jgi:hypothetical protein
MRSSTFSADGIDQGVFKGLFKYPDTLERLRITPDWRWQGNPPHDSGPTIGMFFFVNLAGVIFYTKNKRVKERLEERVRKLATSELLVGHELKQIWTEESLKGLILRGAVAGLVMAALVYEVATAMIGGLASLSWAA